jgi:phage terminase large subunit-like protein
MSTVLDPVTRYATDAVEGRILVSRLVRQACARHLRDLETGAERGLVFKADKAQRAIDFFAEVLYLPENTAAGEQVDDLSAGDPQPFALQPWQAFVVGSLFGWYSTSGFRRFREAYIETAKGSGKTPLGAGIMLYLLVADQERGAQVFLAAVGRDQAKLAWADVEKMVKASPELYELFGEAGLRASELRLSEDGSYLKPISSEKRGLDGKRVHGALIDELHEHPTAVVVNKMRAGTKGRRNALIVKTTNSGFDRTSVCWAHHELSRHVLSGSVVNDAWFAFICGLDACDACDAKGRWFPDEECPSCDDWKTEGTHWLKANPNLGVSLPWQYIRERVTQAIAMPSEASDVLRFNFCVWTQAATKAIDINRWALCGREALPSEDDLLGEPCYAALDLGQTDDFSAFSMIWTPDDGRVVVKTKYWIPRAALENPRNAGRPFQMWMRAGLLEVTDGEVTDYGVIETHIRNAAKQFGIRIVGYDRRFAEQMRQNLEADGITMVDVKQGFALSGACRRLHELIAESRLRHGGDPILSWMAGNYVESKGRGQYADQVRPAKETAQEKIDGIVALIMALFVWIQDPDKHTGDWSPEVMSL